jgi:hypothetical protein
MAAPAILEKPISRAFRKTIAADKVNAIDATVTHGSYHGRGAAMSPFDTDFRDNFAIAAF